MCSHLDLIVNFEISHKDTDESSETTDASESRRWLSHKDTIHKSLSNMNFVWWNNKKSMHLTRPWDGERMSEERNHGIDMFKQQTLCIREIGEWNKNRCRNTTCDGKTHWNHAAMHRRRMWTKKDISSMKSHDFQNSWSTVKDFTCLIP